MLHMKRDLTRRIHRQR